MREGFHPKAKPVHWYIAETEGHKDPLRRRDALLSSLFTEKDGLIETGAQARRDVEAAIWRTSPPSSSDGNDDDPLRRRDSPLHDLPHHGILEGGAPEPRLKDPHAWFVNVALSSPARC
ncbi:MAG: hypothetical protein Q9175_001072 [Cornicularia normoerica]